MNAPTPILMDIDQHAALLFPQFTTLSPNVEIPK
jgi:hypothetical protein